MRIVLLPGMDGTGELFAPLLEALPAGVTAAVVRYPDRAATYVEHEAVARRELPRDEPFVLLGESFSGPIAISIAAAPPPNLRALILCASFLTSPHRLLRPLRALTPLASPKLVPGFLAHFSLLGRFASPALRTAQAQAQRHVAAPTLTARLRAMADVDVREQMRATAVPMLYLRASEDRMIAARCGDEVMRYARHGHLRDVEGPHLLLQAKPAECARLICEFVRDSCRAPVAN